MAQRLMQNAGNYAAILFVLLIGPSMSLADATDTFGVAKNPVQNWAIEIGAARESIEVATYKFSSKDALAALVAARKRGVKVTLLIDGVEATKSEKQVAKACEAGIDVFLWQTEINGELHAKFSIIDGKILVMGSFNLSKAATKENTESFLITRDTTLVGSAATSFKNLLTQSSGQ